MKKLISYVAGALASVSMLFPVAAFAADDGAADSDLTSDSIVADGGDYAVYGYSRSDKTYGEAGGVATGDVGAFVGITPNFLTLSSAAPSGYFTFYDLGANAFSDFHFWFADSSIARIGEVRDEGDSVTVQVEALKSGYTNLLVYVAGKGFDGYVSIGVSVASDFDAAVSDPSDEFPFTDVARGAWYYEPVFKGWSDGWVKGYAGTTLFGPNDSLTRAQAAVFLYRIYGGDASFGSANRTPFADVASGAYYTEAVNWAYASGTMLGYSGSDKFGVDDPLTREQLMVILARMQGADTAAYDADVILAGYPDESSVSGYAAPSVAWAVYSGVVSGVAKGDVRYLDPLAATTRAQIVAMLVSLGV